MIEFSQCGFSEGPSGAPTRCRCPHPAAFTGLDAQGAVTVACFAHYYLLGDPHAIHGFDSVDGETLARVAENQAAMEQLLDSRGT